jgi:hypothetical protein
MRNILDKVNDIIPINEKPENLIFSFYNLSTSLDLFCNFQKTFESFEKIERCTQIIIFIFYKNPVAF